MDNTFDAIVIGAGYIGCSVASHLSSAGLKTALFDKGGMAAGASRANFGNIQIQDMELSKSTDMISLARTRFQALEEELGRKVMLRRIGGLLLVENENQRRLVEERMRVVRQIGVPSEWIPAQRLQEVEPLIDPGSLLGGLYHEGEGQVDPFLLMWAYLVKGRQAGLKEFYFNEIIDIEVKSGRVAAVTTSHGRYYADHIILCTGANTRQLGRMVGREWDIHYVLGQAMVTEPAGLLRCHCASASFFEEENQGEKGAVRANFAISQSPYGHLMLGEAMYEADHFQRHVPASSLPAIAACVPRYFPSFRKLRVYRGWSAPVAHTSDSCPLLGPVEGLPGLYLAVAFRSTVIVTPLIGETIAQLVTQGKCELNIANFRPERNAAYAH